MLQYLCPLVLPIYKILYKRRSRVGTQRLTQWAREVEGWSFYTTTLSFAWRDAKGKVLDVLFMSYRYSFLKKWDHRTYSSEQLVINKKISVALRSEHGFVRENKE